MTDAVLWVYVTASDTEEATAIGRALVREGLAACVNILPGHTAIYRDAGVLREAEEVALVAKTTAAQFAPLRTRIRALHSYELPAILALPAVDGDAEFLDWVRAAVGAA
jgi:periplasmic divalent cation tolerance protein